MIETLTPIRTHVDDLQAAIETGRNNRIGGSDCGTIMGLNKYKSAYTLWAEMCGFIEPRKPSPDNERIRLGHDLEQYAAQRWMEFTGKKCRADNSEYSLAEFPFMVGHIDRRVIGESAGLEIKTTSEFNKTDFAAGEIEPQWHAQCVFYMAVTGLQKWYIAVLQFGKGFFCLEVPRNEQEIQAVVETCAGFWKLVQDQTAPVVDGSDSTTETLTERYRAGGAGEVVDFDPLGNLLEERARISEAVDRMEKQKKEIDNRLKEAFGEHEIGVSELYRLTWKAQSTTRIDSARLKKERPDLFEEYSKTTESRVLRITRKKQKGETE